MKKVLSQGFLCAMRGFFRNFASYNDKRKGLLICAAYQR